jgi:hypothetical protein
MPRPVGIQAGMDKMGERRLVPKFTVGLILGFGLVGVMGLVLFRPDRRAAQAVERTGIGATERPVASTIRLKVPGAQFTAPADIPIEAEVEAPTRPALVEFYHGPIKIGESAAAPYRCTWKGLRYPGAYQLSAKLVGGSGSGVESPTVWVWVDRETR